MKRFFYLFILGAVAMLSSCNNSDEDTYKTEAGVYIYYVVNFTDGIAVDPINVATRLNILYIAAGGDESKFSTATTAIGDKDYVVRDMLFGENVSIVETSTGVFAVTYSESYSTTYDVLRRGTYIINTNNTSLYEDNSEWTITMGQSKADNDIKPYLDIYDYYEDYYIGDNSTYTIKGSSIYEFVVSGTAYPISSQASDESEAAAWNIDMTISFPEAYDIEDIYNTENEIVMQFANSGLLVDSEDSSSSLVGENITYVPSLSRTDFISGEINAYDPNSTEEDSHTFPSPSVNIVRTYYEDYGYSFNTVTYNGITEVWYY